MKPIRISQSLMKEWQSFVDEEVCGSIFEAKYITKEWGRNWGDSDAKALGRYFEFILTGAMPTGYKEYPRAQYYAATAKKIAANQNYRPEVKEMLAPYQFAHKQADRVLELMRKSDIKIESAQVFREKGALTGNIDVEGTYQGKEVNIDIKYSGLVFDRWSKFGWVWSPLQMDYNGKQAKHYEILNGRPTYFLVVSSDAKKPAIKFFKAEVSEEDLIAHEEKAMELIETIAMVNDIGWKNFPSLDKCESCPLKNKCDDAQTTLEPEIIHIINNF